MNPRMYAATGMAALLIAGNAVAIDLIGEIRRGGENLGRELSNAGNNLNRELSNAGNNLNRELSVLDGNVRREAAQFEQQLRSGLQRLDATVREEVVRRLEQADREYNETRARLARGETTWRDLEVFRDNTATLAALLADKEPSIAAVFAGISAGVDTVLKHAPVPEDKHQPVRDSLKQKSSETLEAKQAEYQSIGVAATSLRQPDFQDRFAPQPPPPAGPSPRQLCLLELQQLQFAARGHWQQATWAWQAGDGFRYQAALQAYNQTCARIAFLNQQLPYLGW